jgi:hypothetical protein
MIPDFNFRFPNFCSANEKAEAVSQARRVAVETVEVRVPCHGLVVLATQSAFCRGLLTLRLWWCPVQCCSLCFGGRQVVGVS